MSKITVVSPNVRITEEFIESDYRYETTKVFRTAEGYVVCMGNVLKIETQGIAKSIIFHHESNR
jgi:hypothetical protein